LYEVCRLLLAEYYYLTRDTYRTNRNTYSRSPA